ncbi:MAG: hypothetical protein IJ191_00115 [Treponema sp.]|nr:hypothetical protein [Treponema sp.]
MEYIIMGIAAVIIIAALSYFIQRSRPHRSAAQPPVARPSLVNCPLCGSRLAKGEDIATRVWRPMNVPEQRIAVYGCPHCYPNSEPGITRICPVCHETVPPTGHLVAHLFNLVDGKKHVTVTGCVHCVAYEPYKK